MVGYHPSDLATCERTKDRSKEGAIKTKGLYRVPLISWHGFEFKVRLQPDKAVLKSAKHATLFSRVNAYLADFPLPGRIGRHTNMQIISRQTTYVVYFL